MINKINLPCILANRSFKRDVTASTAFGMNFHSFQIIYWKWPDGGWPFYKVCSGFGMCDMSSYNGLVTVFRNSQGVNNA